jgi:hypothetical protein
MSQRRVSDLKVSIRDSTALTSVTPESILGYLDKNGHERQERLREETLIGYDVKVAAGVGPAERIWLFAPQRADYADYTARVGDFVREIAELEGRSELAVLLELLGLDEPLPLLPLPA